MSQAKEALPYRPCAGVMLLNADGDVFVGARIDTKLGAWQMPQGGIDDGEDAEAAAYRELEEETGVRKKHTEFVAKTQRELTYDLPEDLIGKVWGGKFRGQRQSWFLLRFTGTDSDVNIETKHPEFQDWKWAHPSELPGLIVPFKQQLYRQILDEFADYLDR